MEGRRVSAVTHWSEQLFSLRVEADLAPYLAGQFTRCLALMLPGSDGALERVAHAYLFVNPPGWGITSSTSSLSRRGD